VRRRAIRVAHVVRSLDFGGAEKMVLRLAGLQKAAGNAEPRLLCIAGLGPLEGEARAIGLEPELVGMGGIRFLSPISRVAGLLRRDRPDIVHTHNLVAHTHAAPAARMLGIPVVHTKHGRQVTSFGRPPGLRRLVYSLADRIAVVSQDTGKSLLSKAPVDRRRLRIVYNGIDPARYRGIDRISARKGEGLAQYRFVAGSVSRLDPVKDHPTMLRSFAAATAGRDDCAFLVVGDGPERGRIERLTGELGIAGRVLMRGFTDEIPAMLACMDMFLQPSTEEGLSLTILEAMAAGVPVVSTAVGGTPEIIADGTSGTLIRPGDVGALAEAIERFLADPAPFVAMAAEASRLVDERFSLDRMNEAYDDIYRELLAERGTV
jgi:glycosyltransferase involved in cell wall biosynthesis